MKICWSGGGNDYIRLILPFHFLHSLINYKGLEQVDGTEIKAFEMKIVGELILFYKLLQTGTKHDKILMIRKGTAFIDKGKLLVQHHQIADVLY